MSSTATAVYEQGHSARAPRGEVIRFGLAAVKGVGRGAVEEIIRARQEEGPFECIFDMCQRIDLRTVNKGALEALVKAGAFDSLGGHRGQTMAALEDAIASGSQMQRDKNQGQLTFFSEFENAVFLTLVSQTVVDLIRDQRDREFRQFLQLVAGEN